MKNQFAKEIRPLCEVAERFPWTSRRAYALYLSQTYYYLIHSTRLLGLGAARFSAAEEGLHRRYLDHAREEKSHHLLALKDLENMGYKLADYPEMSITRMVYEPQYYKIEHLDPTALFGYILALEGVSAECAGRACEIAEKAHGKNASGFLRVHGVEDPDHLEKAFQWIESLDSKRIKIIQECFTQSCETLSQFFATVGAVEKTVSFNERARIAA